MISKIEMLKHVNHIVLVIEIFFRQIVEYIHFYSGLLMKPSDKHDSFTARENN